MLKQFTHYFSVGIFNTLIHWAIFFILYYVMAFSQSYSNLLAFIIAVIFSFVMNAKFTFKQKMSSFKFISYISFMGLLSYVTGYLADYFMQPVIITLLSFSILSLILGFLYSKFIVFRREE